jgi:MoaA/NifB/PqqE/SkfB family radical SAM enzyme
MQNVAVSDNAMHQRQDATYIMQGNANEKALDIYHLIIAPTYSCNLRCKHCYLPDQRNTLLPKHIALRLLDEWSDIVLKERGPYGGIFHIKGGEPFMVPYLWDMTDKLTELKSLRLMLTTNGTLNDEETFRKLSKCIYALAGNVTIIVSLDGATEETHSILRGQGCFDKTIKFIKKLHEYEINFHLNCVIHNRNIRDLSDYLNLGIRCGATQVNFLSFIPRGSGSSFRTIQVPHNELYSQLDNFYKIDNQTKTILTGSMPDIKYREKFKGCSTSEECVAAYRGLFYITPDGSIFTCPNITFADQSIGNAHKQNLREISKNHSTLYRQIKSHSGAFLCTGEKMLYEKSNNVSCLHMLNEFQEKLPPKSFDLKAESLLTSYCFNRNW